LRSLFSRLRGIVRARRSDRDVRDQIAAHLEEAADEYIRQGMSPEEAARAARLDFGGVNTAEEASRDVRGGWLRDLGKDLGYAVRMLRRSPAVAAVAVSSIAIGIGANSAIFSIADAMLMRPRPLANPHEIVELFVGDRRQPYETSSHPSYVDLRDRNEVFTGLAAYGIRQFRFGNANEVEQVWGEAVSGNYFDVLGLRADRGRMLSAADDLTPGNSPVVVISNGLWRRRFNSDPHVIGQAVSINGRKLTLIGVAPPQYSGMIGGVASEVWVPTMMMPVLEPSRGQAILTRHSRWLMLVGRLKAGTTLEQARAHFDLLSREMQTARPEEWKALRPETGNIRELFVTVAPERDTRMHPGMREGVYAGIALVVAIVNLVLLIACMNLASILLARGVERRREIAVRLALGAGRLRIVRQLLAENLLLGLIAGAAGVVAGVALLNALLASLPALPEGIRIAVDLRLDWRVLTYTAAFSTLTGILFGLYPALQTSRADVSTMLKNDASAVIGGYRKSRMRAGLIVAQVALSLLLLIGAALVLRSLERLRPTRLGFETDNVVVAMVSLDAPRYDRARSQGFYRQISERIAALPGVRAVSLVQGMPGDFMGQSRRGTEIEGYQAAADERMEIDATFVSAHYFANMRIPIEEGREIDGRDREGAPCVAVVNAAFRRRYFPPGVSPVGKHLTKQESEKSIVSCEIIGVARDERWQSLTSEPRPFYWLAIDQANRQRLSVLVHTEGDPAGHITAVSHAVREVDPNLPAGDIQTLRAYFATTAYPFRLLGVLLAACGVMALLLATIGIYGSVSYSVAQRTREVGVRVALGAMRNEIVTLIAGQGMIPVVWGLAIGLGLSLVLTRVLSSALFDTPLLFGVSATDPLTFAAVTAALAVVALVACGVPALRASKVNAVDALRTE
jgi:predicted permease